jgi:chromosome segregation ATPase
MKRLISAATMTLTTTLMLASASANAEISCNPMIAEMNAKSDIVANFASDLAQIESKLQRVENKIADKQSSLSSLSSQIQDTKQLISQKEYDKASMIQSINSIAVEKDKLVQENQNLSHLMNQLSVQIQNLPVRSNALREALREKKRAEKMIEANQMKISSLDQQIQPVAATISGLERSIMSSLNKVEVLKSKKNQLANTQPTISSLQSQKEKAQIQLMQSDSIQQSNLVELEVASEKVAMCKTYTVKYPLALKISKEIYEVGCNNFSPKSYSGAYKNQAQAETLERENVLILLIIKQAACTFHSFHHFQCLSFESRSA